ncbi:MAG: substrate-binding domain-containing protein [Anaerolinea sp.]|nr:substrate-binding domain-containing protein [Anaerolinea sp.]
MSGAAERTQLYPLPRHERTGWCESAIGSPVAQRRHTRLNLIRKPISGAKRTLVVLSLALAGCRAPLPATNPTPETISIRLVTDDASAPLLYELVSHYKPDRALISWDIEVSDGAAVFEWLREGRAPYAFVGLLPPELGTESPYWMTPVGLGGVAFVTHPTNPFQDLSPDQLRDILQGRVRNWSQLGGADIPLTLITRAPDSSDGALVQRMVLGDRVVSRDAQLAFSGADVIDRVSAQPGAVGFTSVGHLTPAVRVLNITGIAPTPEELQKQNYPLRAPIVFAGLRAPGDDPYRAFFAWTQSPEGQVIVRTRYGGLPDQ